MSHRQHKVRNPGALRDLYARRGYSPEPISPMISTRSPQISHLGADGPTSCLIWKPVSHGVRKSTVDLHRAENVNDGWGCSCEIPCGRGLHMGTVMSLWAWARHRSQLRGLFTPPPHGPICISPLTLRCTVYRLQHNQ